jgi:NACalpha-BTF3-like transcription factor
VDPEDVAYIVQELEVDKTKAELTLKRHKGDVVAAIRSLLRAV